MSKDMVRQKEFGKDLGVVHEAVVTGRNVGAGKEFWSGLAHHQGLFTEVVDLVHTKLGINQPTSRQDVLRSTFFQYDFFSLIIDWQNFYEELFQIEVNLSEIRMPKQKQGFNRLLVIIPGMNPQRLFNKNNELFGARKIRGNDDLNTIIKSDRTAERSPYAVWVRDRAEADKELKYWSGSDLKEKSIHGITLEERLVYELKYFKETGEHLDIGWSWTICPGSIYTSTWYMPCVHWSRIHRKLCVKDCHPGPWYNYMRPREVSY